ncbi:MULTISPECIES: hypothetical protein [unclassified Mesorhizobium]|nr:MULTISPECIES: hypothetical protein [unclassified Mesorhizobium]
MTITIFLNGTLVLDRTSRIQTTPPLPAPIPWPPDESPSRAQPRLR